MSFGSTWGTNSKERRMYMNQADIGILKNSKDASKFVVGNKNGYTDDMDDKEAMYYNMVHSLMNHPDCNITSVSHGEAGDNMTVTVIFTKPMSSNPGKHDY